MHQVSVLCSRVLLVVTAVPEMRGARAEDSSAGGERLEVVGRHPLWRIIPCVTLLQPFSRIRRLTFRYSEGEPVVDEHTELLQGTLEMLVLKTLAFEPMHGWGIAHRIERMSNNVFLVAQGSLYPALVRMKRRGWLKTSWRNTENNRRARYYELTPAGRKQLDVHYSTWRRASA